MALSLDVQRSIHGTIGVVAVGLVATFIVWNWQKGRPVAAMVSGLPQPVGNTSAPYSNSQAAPNPYADKSTSWVDNGTPGGGQSASDSYSAYYEG
jgi:hypothetical protein